MKTLSSESAHRLGEIALLTMAFVLPLAFYFRTYDSIAIKTAVLQWGSLTLLFAWLWQGISRGRFQVPASSWSVLLPATLYGAWMLVRFATAPYKVAALPEFLTQLTMLAGFLAAFLGFAGARSASRFATLIILAAYIVALYALAQTAGLDPFIWKGAFGAGPLGTRVFSTLGTPNLCASFFAVAVPLALTLALDPETPNALRRAALGLTPTALFVAILTEAPVGMATIALSCFLYAVIVPAILRTHAALRSAVIAIILALIAAVAAFNLAGESANTWSYTSEFRKTTVSAELRMVTEHPLIGFGPGSFYVHYPRFRPVDIIKMEGKHNTLTQYPELPLLGVAVELGAVGAALWLWLFGASLLTGVKGASALRRAGAISESVYAAGFSAAAAGGLAAAHLGNSGYMPAPGWYVWPLAGLAAGLAPLAARRAAVSVYPLPVSEDIRRALYAPSLLTFIAFNVMPGLWLSSDVHHNAAIYYAKTAQYDKALAHFDRVLPGSPNYTMALYFRGNMLNDQEKYQEALAAYDRLQIQAPDYVQVHAQRGHAYAKLGDWTAAASERALQAALDPIDVRNLIAWSEAARAAGNLDEARMAIARAQALDPNNEGVRLQISANDLLERRQLAKAGQRKLNGHDTAKKPPHKGPGRPLSK
jgi:tetratricopeptide (TPR) repeat protein